MSSMQVYGKGPRKIPLLSINTTSDAPIFPNNSEKISPHNNSSHPPPPRRSVWCQGCHWVYSVSRSLVCSFRLFADLELPHYAIAACLSVGRLWIGLSVGRSVDRYHVQNGTKDKLLLALEEQNLQGVVSTHERRRKDTPSSSQGGAAAASSDRSASESAASDPVQQRHLESAVATVR